MPDANMSSFPTLFTAFKNLPKELRLEIWERALPGPRIVHLARKALRTSDEEDWWKRVRSDRRSEGPAIIPPGYTETDSDHESDYGDPVTEEDLRLVSRAAASQRLLTSDERYDGTMTRAQALDILRGDDYWRRQRRGRNGEQREVWELGHSAPDKLFGFRSEWEIPALLLVCHESNRVAAKVYSQTFAAQGALAQTYFSPTLDTLYLDFRTIGNGFRYSPNSTNEDQLAIVLKDKAVAEELALVENIAVQAPLRGGYRQAPNDASTKEWLQTLSAVFPNLKKLTAVEVYHYEYIGHKPKYDYEDLRLMEHSVDADGTSRINGYRMGQAVKPQPAPPRLMFPKSLLEEAAEDWTAKFPDAPPFKLPEIEYKLMASKYVEKKLMEAAEKVARKEKGFCWYINPRDPTDFEDNVSGDDLDEELEDLLDWY